MTEGAGPPPKRLKMAEQYPRPPPLPSPAPASTSTPSPEIVSLLSWWSATSSSDQRQRLLLDLRPSSELTQQQKRRSLSHPLLTIASLPTDEVKARSFELPARHVQFSILVSADDDDTAGGRSTDEGISSIQRAKQFLLHPDRVASNQNRKFRPWKVQFILVASGSLWKEANELNILRSGTSTDTDEALVSAKLPLPRLWEADGMVRNVLLPFLRKQLQSNNIGKLRIWDMASGAGRDAVFLAEELLSSTIRTFTTAKDDNPDDTHRGLHVTAIDHRYNGRQSKIVQDFFARRGVGHVSSVVKANLSKWDVMRDISSAEDTVRKETKTSVTNVLYCVRFFIRPFVKSMAECSTLGRGTIFAISHFCIAKQGDSWRFDHPNPDAVLERNELRDLFTTSTTGTDDDDAWEVLHDEIALDSDHGRTMIHFVARKR